MPRAYTEHVFAYLDVPSIKPDAFVGSVPRLQTPPYASNTPDVFHRQIRRRTGAQSTRWDAFLITCSDGMLDLAHVEPVRLSQPLITHWVEVVGHALRTNHSRNSREKENLALPLLRDVIGGSDTNLLSRNLTVEMDERWMDDVTIIVQDFT